jgi:hypothetical protein
MRNSHDVNVEQHRDIELLNADGTISIREVIISVFYLRQPNEDIRTEIAESIREFATLVSFESLVYYYNFDGEEEELDAASLDSIIHEEFFSSNRYPNASVGLRGKEVHAPEFYLRYDGAALNNPALPDEAGSFWCWVPKKFFVQRNADFLKFVSNMSNRVPFSSGYISSALAGENKGRKQALGRRYPGLDIASPLCVASDIADRAAGAYWINFAGPELTRALGGTASIRAGLPPQIAVEEFGQGKCKITLGAEPEIGDVNRRNLLPNYRTFAKFLDAHGALHVPERTVYFVDSDGAADREAMQNWHRRFVA